MGNHDNRFSFTAISEIGLQLKKAADLVDIRRHR